MTPTMPGAAWWRRHAGVRLTTALAAAAVIAVALVAAGVLLALLLQRSLSAAVEDAAVQRARDIAATVARDGVERLGRLDGSTERSVVQVIRGEEVLASSLEIDGEPAMTALRPAPGQVQTTTAGVPVGEDDDHRVVALGVRAADGSPVVVVVAQSLEPVEASLQALRPLLLAGIPLLVFVVGTSTFLFVGRTLRPVEAIRQRVARIDGAQLDQRVPVPPARDEVSRLAGTMNDMLERLDAAATAQRRFVSDASHELRSPLATVRTSVEVAQVHPEITDWSRLTRIVLGETVRMQSLVSDMLLLARSDERGLQLRRIEVDLDDLCEQEAQRLRMAGTTVRTDIAPVRLLGDPDRLSRALRNLADNAARHARSTVQLQLYQEQELAVIVVADDGPGIPEQERNRIFERFVRLDESRARLSGGTGLGLAIVRQIVQSHDGAVSVHDSAAGGALFRVTLPLSGQ